MVLFPLFFVLPSLAFVSPARSTSGLDPELFRQPCRYIYHVGLANTADSHPVTLLPIPYLKSRTRTLRLYQTYYTFSTCVSMRRLPWKQTKLCCTSSVLVHFALDSDKVPHASGFVIGIYTQRIPSKSTFMWENQRRNKPNPFWDRNLNELVMSLAGLKAPWDYVMTSDLTVDYVIMKNFGGPYRSIFFPRCTFICLPPS